MGNGSSAEFVKVLFVGGAEHFPGAMKRVHKLVQDMDPENVIHCCACQQEDTEKEIVDTHVLIPLVGSVQRDLMEKAGYLALIMQFGVCLENVDVKAASDMGIPVANIPGEGTGNAESVAELAIFHALQCLRRTAGAKQSLATSRLGAPTGKSIFGSHVFILGLGAVGRQIASRIRGFSPARLTAVRRRGHVDDTALVDECGVGKDVMRLSHGADIVFVCLKNCRAIITADFLNNLKHGAVLVNVASGALLDYNDVLAGDPNPNPRPYPNINPNPNLKLNPNLTLLTLTLNLTFNPNI